MDIWVQFPYSHEDNEVSQAFPNGHAARRPVAGVVLANGRNEVGPFMGIMDTGADYCTFPSDYLEKLGIDRAELPTAPVYGVGKDVAPFAEVTLKIEALGEWRVYACFSDSFRGQHFGLLGQLGFFDRFTVIFDARNQVCGVAELR